MVFNSRIKTTEKIIRELKNSTIEFTQSEQSKKKAGFRNLWDFIINIEHSRNQNPERREKGCS
jgi:hypothetical protein